VVATYRAGNHTVFIGSVLAVKIGAEGLPLIYYDRNYQQLKVG
jgi:flavin reductase (DIM6/NTAB) family NADH-FMN oxidoreductase RutF